MFPLPITIASVRRELGGKGLAAYLDAIGNTAQQNETLSQAVEEAVSEFETDCDLFVFQRTILTLPLDAGKVRKTRDANGVWSGDYDVTEPEYDFVRDDFTGHGQLRLRRRPVVSVEAVKLQYGSVTSSTTPVVAFPEDWYYVNREMGVLYIVPLTGLKSQEASQLILLPMLGVAGAVTGIIPMIFRVNYTAGYLPRTFDAATDAPRSANGSPDVDPTPLLRGIRYKAASDVLRSAERAVGAGGYSIAREGLSQSFPSVKFSQAIEFYESEVERTKERLQARQGNALPMFVM
jgi:hypothetical protein